MVDEMPRSRDARAAAEQALVRVVHHYGTTPEFVVLGGLVPELLCFDSQFQHAGTTDIDVQVNLEVSCGAVNTARLERALRNAEFEPDAHQVWRWYADNTATRTVVKFELLADLNDVPSAETVRFDECEVLGAVNLRGTRFASHNYVVRRLRSRIGGVARQADIRFAGLAGFLLAKIAAAYARRKPKDWYDLAFVLLHNDDGGPQAASKAVLQHFRSELAGPINTALDDLLANFAAPDAQGSRAYAGQMRIDHPELDLATLAADAVVAVESFHKRLFDQ